MHAEVFSRLLRECGISSDVEVRQGSRQWPSLWQRLERLHRSSNHISYDPWTVWGSDIPCNKSTRQRVAVGAPVGDIWKPRRQHAVLGLSSDGDDSGKEEKKGDESWSNGGGVTP